MTRTLSTALGCVGFVALLSTAACKGPDGEVGPAGEDLPGDQGPQGVAGPDLAISVTDVFPRRMYLGRTVPVTLSGAATEWTDASALTIDFGAGIEVDPASVKVASPTALAAEITITASAKGGLRRVAVCPSEPADVPCAARDGAARSEPIVAIEQALDVFPTSGGFFFGSFDHLEQGSIRPAFVRSFDPSAPPDPLPQNSTIWVGDQDGITPFQVYPDGVAFELSIDVLTPVGDYGIVFESGPPGHVVSSATAPDLVHVDARAPVEIELGNTAVTLTGADKSTVLSFELPEPALTGFQLSGVSGPAAFALLPASGKFSEAIDRLQFFGTLTRGHDLPAGKYFVVVQGLQQGPGYTFDFNVGPIVPPSCDNDLSPPGTFGEIAVPGEVDCYKFTGSAGQLVTLFLDAAPPFVCGFPNPIEPFVDSELRLFSPLSNEIAFSEDIAPDNWCSAVDVLLPEDGEYQVRVGWSQMYPPPPGQGAFPYILNFGIQ